MIYHSKNLPLLKYPTRLTEFLKFLSSQTQPLCICIYESLWPFYLRSLLVLENQNHILILTIHLVNILKMAVRCLWVQKPNNLEHY